MIHHNLSFKQVLPKGDSQVGSFCESIRSHMQSIGGSHQNSHVKEVKMFCLSELKPGVCCTLSVFSMLSCLEINMEVVLSLSQLLSLFQSLHHLHLLIPSAQPLMGCKWLFFVITCQLPYMSLSDWSQKCHHQNTGQVSHPCHLHCLIILNLWPYLLKCLWKLVTGLIQIGTC